MTASEILDNFHKQFPHHYPVVAFNLGPKETRFPGGTRNFDPHTDPVFWYVAESWPSTKCWRAEEHGDFTYLGEVDFDKLPRPIKS